MKYKISLRMLNELLEQGVIIKAENEDIIQYIKKAL